MHRAQTTGTDLIAVGGRGLAGIHAALLGSVSHHVVQVSTCDVLMAR